MASACVGLSGAAVCAEAPPSSADPIAKLFLLAAAFAGDDTSPSSEKVTAMAFLPGRGVVTWDVTGKTPEQAREAQIEAMGAADARAVQREVDAAAQDMAEREACEAERTAFADQAVAGRLVLHLRSPRFPRPARAALVANRGVGGQAGFGFRNGESLKAHPRMYAFAAVSGRSVGLNVLHDDTGWKNGGVTTDRDGFTGQRQAGIAWRKGPIQTSISYVQQKDHTQVLGIQTEKDHRLMLIMNVQPQAIAGLFGKTP